MYKKNRLTWSESHRLASLEVFTNEYEKALLEVDYFTTYCARTAKWKQLSWINKKIFMYPFYIFLSLIITYYWALKLGYIYFLGFYFRGFLHLSMGYFLMLIIMMPFLFFSANIFGKFFIIIILAIPYSYIISPKVDIDMKNHFPDINYELFHKLFYGISGINIMMLDHFRSLNATTKNKNIISIKAEIFKNTEYTTNQKDWKYTFSKFFNKIYYITYLYLMFSFLDHYILQISYYMYKFIFFIFSDILHYPFFY